VPEVVCRGGAALVSDCCQPPAPAAAIDCRQYPVACDEQDGFCALIFDYEQTLELNLARDVPELQPLRDRVIAEVELDHLEARVAGDELPVRHMDLFVAPAGTTSAGRAGALHLARLGAGPATTSIPLEPEARLAFAAFAVDHRSPFALVLLTHVVQRSGAAWQGTFSVQLTATLTARF
jgi:hypothetical protein